MRYIVFSSALILSLELLGASIATAMPLAGSAVVASSSSTDVIEVSGGCGWFRHRGPHGHCTHNWRGCGPNRHRGPHGHCTHN